MADVHQLRKKVHDVQKPYTKEGNIFYDKILFKNFISSKGVRTPKTYLHITNDNIQDIEKIHQYDEFVLKPNRGACGIDIYTLTKLNPDLYQEISGRQHAWHFIDGKTRQINTIQFSGGVIIEEAIHNPKVFDQFLNGIPGICDMRFYMLNDNILFGKLRVPTIASEGYANTGRKAMAFFVDTKGIITEQGIFNNTSVNHPDLNRSFEGTKVPYWDQFTSTAIQVAKLFKLAFHSVDLTIDVTGEGTVIESEKIPLLNHFTSHGCDVMIKHLDEYLTQLSH